MADNHRKDARSPMHNITIFCNQEYLKIDGELTDLPDHGRKLISDMNLILSSSERSNGAERLLQPLIYSQSKKQSSFYSNFKNFRV